jgi:SOS response regulatory protein OraA/RecX
MDYAKGKKYAFRLLSMRNYHSRALFRKLESKGYSKEICEQVVAECKRLGFLQDEGFVLQELRRGYGPRYIEWKWQLERGEARRVISREMQREQIARFAKKGARALQRRGFDLDLILEFCKVGK